MVRRIRICTSCTCRYIATSRRDTSCERCTASQTDKEDTVASFDYGLPGDDEDDDDDQPLANLLCDTVRSVAESSNEKPLLGAVDLPMASSNMHSNPIGNSTAMANGNEEVLLSEEDEGDEENSVDILADLDEPEEPNTSSTATIGQDAGMLSTFRREQEDLHAQSSHTAAATIATPGKNLDLAMCFVCGASLSHIQSGYKGRLQHIKRCSKNRGVSAKDVRAVDDVEEDIRMVPPVLSKQSSGANMRNPYARTNEWHGKGDGVPPRETVSTKAAPTSFDLLMAGAKRASKTEQIKKQRKKSRGGGGSPFRTFNSASCPKYKKIPGTDFVCDGFQYAGPETKNYFLTHFHSDHYGGITKSWTKGIIYCSFATANLVHEQLGVPRDFLHPLPMHIPTVIESCVKPITVTLVDANHCPGAIMFLFEVGKRTILHVGDFRWNLEHMSGQAPLQPFCRIPWTQGTSQRQLDDLFLDTTYCDPKYCLPSQADCIQVCSCIFAEDPG